MGAKARKARITTTMRRRRHGFRHRSGRGSDGLGATSAGHPAHARAWHSAAQGLTACAGCAAWPQPS